MEAQIKAAYIWWPLKLENRLLGTNVRRLFARLISNIWSLCDE